MAGSESASEVLDTLRSFQTDPRSADASAIRTARNIITTETLSAEWSAKLADEARHVYNRCLETNHPDTMLAISHMRALCLAL